MHAILIALLFALAPSLHAQKPLTYGGVKAAVEKADFKKALPKKDISLWTQRLKLVRGVGEGLVLRLESKSLSNAARMQLEAELWEAFQLAGSIERLIAGPSKRSLKDLGILPTIPAARSLPANLPRVVK